MHRIVKVVPIQHVFVPAQLELRGTNHLGQLVLEISSFDKFGLQIRMLQELNVFGEAT